MCLRQVFSPDRSFGRSPAGSQGSDHAAAAAGRCGVREDHRRGRPRAHRHRNGRQAVIRFDPRVRDRGASGSKRSETAKRLDPHRSAGRGDPQYRAAPGTRTEEARADVVRTLSSVSKGRILLADPKGEECLATPRSGTRLAERRAVCGVRRAAPRGLPGAVPYPPSGFAMDLLRSAEAGPRPAVRSSLAGRNRPVRPCRSPGRAPPPIRGIGPRPHTRTEEACADVDRALPSRVRAASY